MLLRYEDYRRAVQMGLRSGYEIRFVDHPEYSYPRLSVDHDNRVVTVFNQHPKHVESLKAIIANREKYEHEGRVTRVFEGVARPEDLYRLGLTPGKLGHEVYTEFVQKMHNKTLTNRYLKQLLGNKV